MTGITKRMERTGFIIRKNDPYDDRLKWLEITPKGRRVLKDISEVYEHRVTRYLSKYPTTKKTEILAILIGVLKKNAFGIGIEEDAK